MVENHRTPGSPSKGTPATTAGLTAPLFAPDSAAACELLEALDDAMFTAIAGDEGVVLTARDLWMQAVECLPVPLVEESREQYLRYAADVARRLDADEVRDPEKAVVAVEIIELLAGG